MEAKECRLQRVGIDSYPPSVSVRFSPISFGVMH